MEEIGYIIIKILLELFGTYTLGCYMRLFFHQQQVSKTRLFMAYGFRWLFMCVTDIGTSYPVWNTILSVLSIWLITTCYSGDLRKNISVTLKIYLLAFVAECLVAAQAKLVLVQPFEKIQQISIWNIIWVNLFFWIGTFILRKFHHLKEPMHTPKAFVISIIAIFLSVVLLEDMLVMHREENKTVWFISVLCVSLVVFVLIYLYDALAQIFQEKKQQELIQQEKIYYQAQAEVLEQNARRQKEYHHDRKNHFLIIAELLREKRYQEAENYLMQYEESQRQFEFECVTGNLVVDSLINYKLGIAREKNTMISMDISMPKIIPIDENAMVTVLGNLLDNAIEAVERLPENREMDIKIKYEKGILRLNVKNSYDGIVSIQKEQLHTRKKEKDRHGWGLKSVEDVAAQYHGDVQVQYDESYFCVKVSMYGGKI